MFLKSPFALCLGVAMLLGCSREPSEELVSHPTSFKGLTWLRSDYEIIGRESRELPYQSGTYAVLTIKHGSKKITAECLGLWTTATGEDLPSTLVLDQNCRDLPMGNVKLERHDWNGLYYFTCSGKNREMLILDVTKIEPI